jgi:hypothetical protein
MNEPPDDETIDTWPLRVDMVYGDPCIVCDGRTSRTIINGSVWHNVPCETLISGDNLREIKVNLTEHIRITEHELWKENLSLRLIMLVTLPV